MHLDKIEDDIYHSTMEMIEEPYNVNFLVYRRSQIIQKCC